MSDSDLERALEPPVRKKGAAFYILLVLVAFLIIGGGYWVMKQLLVNGEIEIPLPEGVAQVVNEGLRLEDGRIGPVRIGPEQGSEGLTGSDPMIVDEERPSAGGFIAAPGETATALVEEQTRNATGDGRPRIYQGNDGVVTMTFVADLADYLARSYWPRGTHELAQNGPATTASIRGAGYRYGLELIGLGTAGLGMDRDYLRDRSLVLNYAYTPSMVNALTRLYADRLADNLAAAGLSQSRNFGAGEARLDETQVAEMLHFYAGQARALGAAMAAYSGNSEAQRIVGLYIEAQAETMEATARFHDAEFLLEAARDSGNAAGLSNAQNAMRQVEYDYRQAILNQESARLGVLDLMQAADSPLDEVSLLYIASWAARRGPGGHAANRAVVSSADYLGMVLDEKALEIGGE